MTSNIIDVVCSKALTRASIDFEDSASSYLSSSQLACLSRNTKLHKQTGKQYDIPRASHQQRKSCKETRTRNAFVIQLVNLQGDVDFGLIATEQVLC